MEVSSISICAPGNWPIRSSSLATPVALQLWLDISTVLSAMSPHANSTPSPATIKASVNELDALANIDFNTREDKPSFRQLTIVRIGTCGGLQPETPLGTFIASVKSIGFDGLLNYYADRNSVCDLALEQAFRTHMDWSAQKGAPYVAVADSELIHRIAADDMVRGITCACGGFYGPQGRQIRMRIQDPGQNAKIESFRYEGMKICNFEMESSALAGLSSILGHKAMTCCMVVANRYAKEANTGYKTQIDDLITKVINRI